MYMYYCVSVRHTIGSSLLFFFFFFAAKRNVLSGNKSKHEHVLAV